MKLIAHRGLSGFYPENTMLSFKKCLNLDIYGVEFDVRKSKDNHIVVIHDETVDRTFDGRGYVKDMTLEELKNLNSSNKIYHDNKDCKIPTLEEVLTLFKPTDFILDIEIKNKNNQHKDLEKDVVKLVKKYKMQKQVIISSFSMKSLKIVSKHSRHIKTGYLVGEKAFKYVPTFALLNRALSTKCSYMIPNHHSIDNKILSKSHHRFMQVFSYTVDTIEEYNKFLKLKVDGIITNYPNIFIDLNK